MYEKWNPKEPIRRMRFIAKLIDVRPTDKILDIGAFKGYLFKFLGCDKKNYYPIDFYALKDKFKNAVSQNFNENQNLPFQSGSFDKIVFVGTIEHLFYPEEMLKEIKRVLKSDGIAIISFPNDANWYMRFLHLINKYLDVPFEQLKYLHHWFFGERGTRLLMEKYFTIVSKTFYNGLYGRYIPFAKSEIIYKVKKK